MKIIASNLTDNEVATMNALKLALDEKTNSKVLSRIFNSHLQLHKDYIVLRETYRNLQSELDVYKQLRKDMEYGIARVKLFEE